MDSHSLIKCSYLHLCKSSATESRFHSVSLRQHIVRNFVLMRLMLTRLNKNGTKNDPCFVSSIKLSCAHILFGDLIQTPQTVKSVALPNPFLTIFICLT